jgi:stress response protein SCP2
MQRLMGNYADTDFDLDISAYIYDDAANCIDIVTGEKDKLIDSTGCVRHDGDERDGQTTGDDESIVIDLMALPPHIHSLVLICDIASAHAFGDIYNPRTHLADYGTGDDFISAMLGEDEGRDNSGYILAKLQRSGDEAWKCYNIAEYTDNEKIDDWATRLKDYL